MSPLARAAYYVFFGARLLAGRPLPAVAGLSVTDRCNLNCRHCWRKNTGPGHLSFEQVAASLADLHRRGARYLYLQGGEPLTWRDGCRRLGDVIRQARSAGFFHITVCTNGTFGLTLDPAPDCWAVSLDGVRDAHERIRPGTFDRILAHLAATPRRSVLLNATFNRLNWRDLGPLAELAAELSSVRGVLVNFHIPLPGVESLALSQPERARLAGQALALRNAGLPILNSPAALRALVRDDWKRPHRLSCVTDGRTVWKCCRARGSVCRSCGYAGAVELAMVESWRFDAIGNVLRSLR